MEVVIVTRPPVLSDMKLARYFTCLDEKGLLIKLYERPELLLGFLYDLSVEAGTKEKYFESVLARVHHQVKPSDIYHYLQNGSRNVYLAYIAQFSLDTQRFRKIRKATPSTVQTLVASE